MATLLIAILMISTMAAISVIAKKDDGVITLRDGVLEDKWGNPLVLGFDDYGYNYQAHMFNGWYWNNGRPEVPFTDEQSLIDAEKSTTWLMMKWSDTWLSNMDRDGDEKLDRGYPYRTNTEDPEEDPTYTSSAAPGAWLTNHQWGVNEDGTHWYYFVKIVHPGDDAVHNDTDDTWYTAEGVEIGPAIWGAYARILQISNDPALDEHGVLNNWPAPTGFGYYK